LNKVNKINI